MAAALGNFDGIHRGHVQVIKPVLAGREEWGEQECGEKVYRSVVTFTPHPQEFFSGQPRSLLTPLEEKAQELQALGIEQLVLLPFDRELASLTPEAFVEKILIKTLDCRRISVGQDFRFGCDRAGTVAELRAIAAQWQVEVDLVSLYAAGGERISSSRIRQALLAGDVATAQDLLGRPYRLTGRVVQGQQLGRTLGFPTANLQLPLHKFLPHYGVYAVWVAGNEPESALGSFPRPGVMNLGQRPTVAGQAVTVEVHLLDWSGDLYGQSLAVDLVAFLRPEQRFESLEALKEQIGKDGAIARQMLLATQKICKPKR